MPNWCSNHITINGPKDKVEAIWSKANDNTEEGLLGAMVPIGEWEYHTALKTWGTKWDVSMSDSNLDFFKDKDSAVIEGFFESAWSPPLGAVQEYLDNNPDVDIHIKFYEPANDFIGSNLYGDFTIFDQPRSFWETDPIGIDLDETFYVCEMLDEHHEYVEEEHLDNDELDDPEKLPDDV